MKNRKLGLALTLIATCALAVSCGDSNTGTADTGEQVTGEIKFTQSEVEIERQSTKTIRVNTSSLSSEEKTVIFSSPDEGKIISLAEQTSTGDVSIRVKGLRLGTATLVATAVSDSSIKAEIKINVVALKPTLRGAWKSAIGLTNYSIVSYNADDGEDSDPTSIVKVVDDAVIAVDKDGNALEKEKVQTSEDGEEEMSFYGIAISENDLAYYVVKDSKGDWYRPEVSVTSSTGLLRKENFKGKGRNASSFLDVSSFYGIQAINPDWLTNIKADDNTYEIEGDEEDVNSAYAEALLWGLVDPVGKISALSKFTSGYTAPEAAALIDTTITVLDKASFSITITETESQISHVAYIKDVGSTELPSDIASYIKEGGKQVKKPKLNTGLQSVIDTFKKNDYSIYQNLTYGKYYEYYAPTYYWNGVTTAIANSYKTWAEKNNQSSTTLASGGFVTLKDGIYQYTLTENFDDENNAIAPTITLGEKKANSTDLPTAMAYFSTTDAFNEEGDEVYTFRALSTGSGTIYYSTSAVVSNELSSTYFGGYTIKQLIDAWQKQGEDVVFADYGTAIQIKGYDSEGNITAIEFKLGSFGMDGATSGYMFPANITTESCTKTNQYDAAIRAFIEAENAKIK